MKNPLLSLKLYGSKCACGLRNFFLHTDCIYNNVKSQDDFYELLNVSRNYKSEKGQYRFLMPQAHKRSFC